MLWMRSARTSWLHSSVLTCWRQRCHGSSDELGQELGVVVEAAVVEEVEVGDAYLIKR